MVAEMPQSTFVSDAIDTTGCTEVTVENISGVDACGNAATCSQTYTRTVDTTPPSITCPANVTLSGCNGTVPAPNIANVTRKLMVVEMLLLLLLAMSSM
jgi:hypothetical protein